MSAPEVYPALEALVDAYHRRVNGRLVFKRDGVERSVILLFRKVVFANSTEKKDRLELVLATRKLLSKEEVLRIAAKAKSGNVDFMTMVQREGALKDMALFDVISDRARDIITDLITWQEVKIEHDPRGFSAESVLPLNTDLFPILLDGLMERFSADDCRKLLGAEDQVPIKQDRPHVLRDMQLSVHAQLVNTVLERVNGAKAIVDILSGLDPMAGMKILAAMKLLGVVDLPNQQQSITIVPPKVAAVMTPVELDVVTATVDLSSEEKAALSNIFEGATNLLEDDESGNEDLEIMVEEESLDISLETEDDELAVATGLTPEQEVRTLPEEPVKSSEPALEAVDDDPVDSEITTTTPQVQNDFNALLGIDPEEAAKLFSVALELFQRGRISSALKVYQQAIEKDPSNAEYYTSMGIAYLESAPDVQADEHAAMGAFLEAIKLNSETPKNHYYLGKIYERRGEIEAALQYYQEALQRDANYAPAREGVESLGKGSPKEDGKAEGFGFLRKFFGR